MTTDRKDDMQHWIYIERDQGARDVVVGPYPDRAQGALALDGDGGLIEYLLSPSGGGGTECSLVTWPSGYEATLDVHIEAPEAESDWVALGAAHHNASRDCGLCADDEHATEEMMPGRCDCCGLDTETGPETT